MDIILTPIFPLGLSGEAIEFDPSDYAWDYAIDGLPFLSAISDERRYQRGFIELNKNQFDTSDEAGEQSLDNGTWVRSQSQFSGGAGREIYESTTDPATRTQFWKSSGVNPWEESVTLLNDVTIPVAAGAGSGQVVTSGPGEVTYLSPTFTVSRVTTSTVTSVTGAASSPTWIESAGSKILACHILGIDAAASTVFSPLWTQVSGVAPQAWWMKQRILATRGQDVYELSLAGGDLDAETPIYTHPDTGWVWTSATETPDAILLSGYSGSSSAIYKIILDTDGGLPTLSAATTTAELPRGEIVYSLATYLGSYLAIGTNRGLRIGQIGTEGLISYGPISAETTSPVYDSTAYGRFIFATYSNGIDGNSGLVRVDLSTNDRSGRQPWATDLNAKVSGTVYSVAPLGGTDTLAFVVDGAGLVLENTATKVASGYLETSQVRYSTLQPKHFLYATARTPKALDGVLTVSTLEPDGDVTSVLAFPQGQAPDERMALNRRGDTGEVSLGLRFDLARGTTVTLGASLSGWQLEAIPAVTRGERLEFWVQCSDNLRDRYGNRRTSEGYAYSAFLGLRDAAKTSRQVRFQDFGTGEALVVVIDDVNFISTTPRGRDSGSQFGGFINIALHTI